MQEIWPSGEAGSAVTMGDYVRDVFLEQVQQCILCQMLCFRFLLMIPDEGIWNCWLMHPAVYLQGLFVGLCLLAHLLQCRFLQSIVSSILVQLCIGRIRCA